MPLNPLLILQHVAHEGPGLFGEFLKVKNIGVDIVNIYDAHCLPNPSDYKAVITLGGPQSANDRDAAMQRELRNLEHILRDEIPYLGVCLGMQTLVQAAGGQVVPCRTKETGWHRANGSSYQIELTADSMQDPLLMGLPPCIDVFQLHGETVTLSDTTTLLATAPDCPNQLVRAGSKAYGIQSHVELTRSMLEAWATIDPDLAQLDRTELTDTYAINATSYQATASSLFENFLAIAGI